MPPLRWRNALAGQLRRLATRVDAGPAPGAPRPHRDEPSVVAGLQLDGAPQQWAALVRAGVGPSRRSGAVGTAEARSVAPADPVPPGLRREASAPSDRSGSAAAGVGPATDNRTSGGWSTTPGPTPRRQPTRDGWSAPPRSPARRELTTAADGRRTRPLATRTAHGSHRGKGGDVAVDRTDLDSCCRSAATCRLTAPLRAPRVDASLPPPRRGAPAGPPSRHPCGHHRDRARPKHPARRSHPRYATGSPRSSSRRRRHRAHATSCHSKIRIRREVVRSNPPRPPGSPPLQPAHSPPPEPRPEATATRTTSSSFR